MATLTVGVVIYDENKVLLVRHTEKARLPTGSYGFPAGRVEPSETLEAAAIRELYEETGLITEERYLRKLPYEARNILQMREGFEKFIFNVFACDNYLGKLRSSEKTIPEWVALDSLDDLLLASDNVKEIARRFHE